MASKIVVVGGGQAAASFAAKLRSLDADCQITIVSDENHLPYQRPPLSKKYATGDMSREQLLLRPADWYEANNVQVETGNRVTAIDPERKSVSLANGQTPEWDKLVLATGSRPRSLPSAIGGGLDGVLLLRGMDDADAISPLLVEGKRVVIVGGGYIGLEAAAVCASKGLKVTLLEAAPRILQRVACKETSDWFRNLHEGHGVTVREDAMLERFEDTDGKVSAAILKDGSRIECDFALVGIGIIPNDDLASEAGLKTAGGIVVNEFCQTSNPDIYAAGDCAVFGFKGEQTRLESVQNAIDQAECAAKNISGEPTPYTPYPWFWSDQYDVKLQIAGLNRGYDQVVVRAGAREGSVSHFYFAGEELLAVDCINDGRSYMIAKKLLEAGKGMTPTQAADPELVLKSLL